MEEKILFIVDDTVLKKILEDTTPGTTTGEMLEKLTKLTKANPEKHKAVTTMSSLLRAIHESSENASMSRLKDILDTIDIFPSEADYKNEKAVREEIIFLANGMSKPRPQIKPGVGG